MHRPQSSSSLAPEIDPVIRTELPSLLKLVDENQSAPLVLTGLSRLTLVLLRQLFQSAGATPPSDNLFDCILVAGKGDPQSKTKGLQILPDEIATGLHTIRIYSNKSDHAAESISLTPSDARTATDLFLRALRWFYTEFPHGPKLPSIWQAPRRSRVKILILALIVGLGLLCWGAVEQRWFAGPNSIAEKPSTPKPEQPSPGRETVDPKEVAEKPSTPKPEQPTVRNPKTAAVLQRLKSLPPRTNTGALFLEILAQREGRSNIEVVPDGARLASEKDLYRIYAAAPADGFLYLFQVDSSSKLSWLFPKNESGKWSYGSNPVRGGELQRLPDWGNENWQTLDRQTGKETVFAIFSPNPWPELEADLRAAAGDTSPPEKVIQILTMRHGIRPDQPRGIGGEKPFAQGLPLKEIEDRMRNNLSKTVKETGRLVESGWFEHID